MRNIRYYFFASVLFGGIKGALNYGSALYVEQAQVVANIVHYLPETIQYRIIAARWSILPQLFSGLLVIGLTEQTLSILIGYLEGFLSFLTILLGINIVTKSKKDILAVALFIFHGAFLNTHGMHYPIMLFSGGHAFGGLGLTISVLSLILVTNKYPRIGFLIMGLSIGIHAPLGLWLVSMYSLSIFAYKLTNSDIRIHRHLYWLALGILFSCISLILHKIQFPILTDGTTFLSEIAISKEYIDIGWDAHRGFSITTLESIYGFMIGGGSILLAANSLYGRWRKMECYESTYYLFCIVSGIFSITLIILAALSIPIISGLFDRAMVDRLLNFVILLNPILLFGTILRHYNDWRKFLIIAVSLLFYGLSDANTLTLVILNVFVVCSTYGNKPIRLSRIVYLVFSISLIWIYKSTNPYSHISSAYVISLLLLDSLTERLPLVNRIRLNYLKPYAKVSSLLFLLIPYYVFTSISEYDDGKFQDWESDAVYGYRFPAQALILQPINYYDTQLKTRTSTLVDAETINSVPYSPIIRNDLVDVLKNIYGIDYLNPVKTGSPEADPLWYRNLWESYSKADWRKLAMKYKVTHLIGPAKWEISLSPLATNGQDTLYQIGQPMKYPKLATRDDQ
jgi:hypothetical protein